MTMMPQPPYRLPHQHPDLARHIDCGLYAWISTLLLIYDHSLSILTLSAVHRLRVYMAHYLLQNPTNFDVHTILGQLQKRRPTSSGPTSDNPLDPMPDTRRPLSDVQQSTDPTPADTRLATLRPRHKPSVSIPTPLPDRQRHSIIIADPAIMHTHVAESTVPGAGKGLFTARYFNGNDEDSAYIGEYFEGEKLTEDTILDEDYFADYAIQREGLIRDAWDHKAKRIPCATVYVNNPLDEELENSKMGCEGPTPLSHC